MDVEVAREPADTPGVWCATELTFRAIDGLPRIEPGDGPVFIHADSAALLAAGLLAGASLRRTMAILPHAQPAYLAEVGAGPGSLIRCRISV